MSDTAMRIKAELLKAIQELPDDVEFDEAMDRLLLMHKIQKGEAQADAGQVVTHEEAKRRMEKWRR
jgi:hypothetical protein